MRLIASIDGGGVRGLIPARILERLEVKIGKPCAEIFDLIAGNSTGAIIACGLAQSVPAKTLADLYANYGSEIFAASLVDNTNDFWGVSGPKYQASSLEAILRHQLGGVWLSASRKPELLCPSMCIGPDYGPHFFTSWDARKSAADDYQLWQVARCSSAAETYFPPMRATSRANASAYFCDGGTFANNPTLDAIQAAQALWPGEPLTVLSLGTGTHFSPLDGKDAEGWGDAEWALHITDVCLDGTLMVDTLRAAKVPGATVHRVNTAIPPDAAAMADASATNIARLEAIAAKLEIPSAFLDVLDSRKAA